MEYVMNITKSSFSKLVKSNFDENLVFNIRSTLELVTEWNLDPDNSRKYIFSQSKLCIP